ncbi:MAG: patatin-like phospholipase family protein [Isosphaeraceae bacterium]
MSTSDRPLEFDRLACITIQGGGVFGINLLGQLQAVLELGFLPVALSGTSAGAIVAAFFWARLDPPQILKLLVSQAGSSGGLTELLGPFDTFRDQDGKERHFTLSAFRELQYRLVQYRRELFRFHEDISQSWVVRQVSIARAYLKYKPVLPGEVSLLGRLFRKSGVFAGDNLESFINETLRSSPYVLQNEDLLPKRVFKGDDPLTFGHFKTIAEQGWFQHPQTGRKERPYLPPLFLTATNLTTRTLELINSEEDKYEGVPVARAVRASAGFPVFFQPVTQRLEKNEYSLVDGGMIANYPAFVFGTQFREWLASRRPRDAPIVSRPWVHVGLRLTSHRLKIGRAGEASDPHAFILAMRELLVSQARNELEEKLAEYVPRSISVDMSLADSGGPTDVLGVEKLKPADLEAMFHNGRAAGFNSLGRYRFAYPPTSLIEPLLEQLIEEVEGVFRGSSEMLRFRCNIFVPKYEQLLLYYRARMQPPPSCARIEDPNPLVDWDWNLELPYRSGLTGFCFVRRTPLVCNLEKFKTLFDGQIIDPRRLFGFDHALQSKIRGDRSWLLSVPIFDPDSLTIRPLDTKFAHQEQAGQLGGQYYSVLEGNFDGPVFGVLNLDAGWNYTRIQLTGEVDQMIFDPRVYSTLALMQRQALRVGKVFSGAFPDRSETSSIQV